MPLPHVCANGIPTTATLATATKPLAFHALQCILTHRAAAPIFPANNLQKEFYYQTKTPA